MTSNQNCNSVQILQAPHISYQTALLLCVLCTFCCTPCSRIQIIGWTAYNKKEAVFLMASHQQLLDQGSNCFRDNTTGPVPAADWNLNSCLCPEVNLELPRRQDRRTKIDACKDFIYSESLDEQGSSCASKTYQIMKKISSEEAGSC